MDEKPAIVKRRTTKEIADAIHLHLRRFERDPKINPIDPKYKTRPYYMAGAGATGNGRVWVRYVAYQLTSYLTRADAARYLAWLDAGNVGRHCDALRSVE